MLFTEENIDNLLLDNHDMKILWCFRHPVSNAMSKIIRGRKASEGGDKRDETVSDDATLESAIKAVKYSYEMCMRFSDECPVENVMLELLILDPEYEKKRLSEFLEVDIEKIDIYAFRNTLNNYHEKRYGNKIDKKQAHIYKNWKTAYDGYFADKNDWIDRMKSEFKDMAFDLGYDIL
jgi:hypothetical protein